MKRSSLLALCAVLAVVAVAVEAMLPPHRFWALPLGAVELLVASFAGIAVAHRFRRGAIRHALLGVEIVAVLTLLLFIYAKGRTLVEIALSAEPGLAIGHTSAVYTAALATSAVVGLGARTQSAGSVAALVVASPARLMTTSFLAAMLAGTVVLTLPASVADLGEVSVIDALFTATSAVCVTGLAVNDIGQTYTTLGQVMILLLIQAGGLGIMTIGTTVAAFGGGRLRVRQSADMAEMLDARSFADMRKLIRRIIGSAVVCELIGAIVLYRWLSDDARAQSSPMFYAGFHAVSAFCNAGFSLFSDNLSGYANRPAVCATVAALIVAGGIGFPVIDELVRAAIARILRRPRRRLSLHTRVVLVSTAVLIAGGAVVFLALEWRSSLGHLGALDRLSAAVFHSISARTAGFNTVDLAVATPAALLVLMTLMLIGASPASTGGGMKTTTVFVFFASLRTLIRGRTRTEVQGRTIPESVLSRALAVTAASALTVVLGIFALVIVEPHEPLKLMFEAVSAFSTTGLSAGITSSLSPGGKLLLILMMLAGRVGPLTLAIALGDAARQQPIAYPEERVLVG